METELRQAVRQVSPNLGTLAFGAALIMAQFMALINFKGVGFSTEVAMIYIIMPPALMTYLFLDQQSKAYKLTLEPLRLVPMLVHACIGFLLTWATVLFVLGYALGIQFGTTTTVEVAGLIVMQVLFVACSEELVFRYLLPSYFGTKFRSFIPAMVISQTMFALFHWGVYGGAVTNLLIAFIIGMIWVSAIQLSSPMMKGKLGLGFSIGSHAAYNLCLLGVLAGNITTVYGGV